MSDAETGRGHEGDEPRVPTTKELEALTQWARVAFAARCARRVLTLLALPWPKPNHVHRSLLDHAVTTLEHLAGRGIADNTIRELIPNAIEPVGASIADSSLQTATENIVRTVRSAIAVAERPDYTRSVQKVVDLAKDSVSAMVAQAPLIIGPNGPYKLEQRAVDKTVREMCRDYQSLLHLAQGIEPPGSSAIFRVHRNVWTNNTPVPPWVFGPMWPEGTPDGWPLLRDEGESLHLKIEIAVPSGMNEAESKAFNKRVATFFAKLSGAHVALGGTGLRLLDHSSCAPLPELDEEPVGADSGCAGKKGGCHDA